MAIISAVDVVNTVIRVIAGIHLSYYGVYSMYKAEIPEEVMAIDKAFCGKFKYLTFWNVCLEALYFWFAIVDSVAALFNKNGKLRKIRDHYFLSVVFPLSAFVSFTFWVLWAIDRELVMPKSVDVFFPSWLNQTVHTSIIFYSILELLTSYHKCAETVVKQCYSLWLVNIAYVIWCHVVYYQTELWVYPILKELNLGYRMLFFLACLALATVFLVIGYYANNSIWKKRVEKKSLDINSLNQV